MPVYYQTKIIPGIPEISFWSAVLLPIAFVWVFNNHCEGYRFSPLDLLIILHLILVFSGEWHNSTYKEAQKVFYNDLTIRLLPCIMARAWFMDSDSRIKMFKIIIVCGAIVAAFQTIAFRFWFNVFDDILRKIWPQSVHWGGMKRGERYINTFYIPNPMKNAYPRKGRRKTCPFKSSFSDRFQYSQ